MTKGGSNPKKQVVVKFVQRYSGEVHDVLAAVGMAPSLLYYGHIDPDVDYRMWKMVVMDYFDAKPSYDGDRHRDADVSKKVFEAIKVVHSAGYVLGDVRPPNVMSLLARRTKSCLLILIGRGRRVVFGILPTCPKVSGRMAWNGWTRSR
jgi:hypothetical protein